MTLIFTSSPIDLTLYSSTSGSGFLDLSLINDCDPKQTDRILSHATNLWTHGPRAIFPSLDLMGNHFVQPNGTVLSKISI